MPTPSITLSSPPPPAPAQARHPILLSGPRPTSSVSLLSPVHFYTHLAQQPLPRLKPSRATTATATPSTLLLSSTLAPLPPLSNLTSSFESKIHPTSPKQTFEMFELLAAFSAFVVALVIMDLHCGIAETKRSLRMVKQAGWAQYGGI
ncbi:hypothetical protein BKA81DRAFT_380190 [Phyllosticta paracitricarpa]